MTTFRTLCLLALISTASTTMNCDDKASLCPPCPNGGANSDCVIQCGGLESCTGKSLDCSLAGRCTINCLKERSCKGAIIKCPLSTQLKPGVTSGCILNCNGGDGSCEDAQVDNPVDDVELNCDSNSQCDPYAENCAGIRVNNVLKNPPTSGGIDCTIKWIAIGLKMTSPTWAEVKADLNTKLLQLRDTLKQSLIDAGRSDANVKITLICPLLPGGKKPTASDSLSSECIDPNQQFTTQRLAALLGADDGVYVESMLQGPAHYLPKDAEILEDTLRDASMGRGTLVNPTDSPNLIEIDPLAYLNGEYSMETQSQESDSIWSKARAVDWSEPEPSSDSTDFLPIILIAVGGCLFLLLILVAVGVVIRGKSRRNQQSEMNQEMKVSEFLGGKNSSCLETMEEAECVLTDYYRHNNRGVGARDAGSAAPMASARLSSRNQQTGSVSRSSSESSDGQNRHSPTTGGNPAITRPSGRGSSTRTVMSPPMRVRAFPQSTRRF